MAKRKLGRGLDVLIGASDDRKSSTKEAPRTSERSSENVKPRRDRSRSKPPTRRVPELDESDVPESPPETGSPASTESKSPEPAIAPETSSEAPKAEAKGPPSQESKPVPAEPAAPEAEDSNPRTRLELVNPKRIGTNPAQPRRVFSAADLATLKTSVERDGLLQPILVRRVDGDLQLIAGERRLRAAKELGLEEIPARVVDVPDDRMLEIALIENVHRADLNPIELAEAYRALLVERDWTQDQLSGELGVSRSAISNSLRLLDLPGDMQRALVRGQISSGHAKVLLSVDNDDTRHELFERIAEDNLSVRDLEAAKGAVAAIEPVDEVAAKPDLRRPEKKPKKPYILSLESELSEHLGSKVRIRERRGGKGVVSIDFYSKDGFERLRQLLTRDL